MENKFRIIDIVLSVVLVVLMFIGIGVGISKISTSPHELTIENYKEYLSIQTSYQTVGTEIKYTMMFEPATRFKVSNVNATVYIRGRSIESQKIEVSFSATNDKPYKYEIAFKYTQPTYSEDIFDFNRINVTVTSISGQISRG